MSFRFNKKMSLLSSLLIQIVVISNSFLFVNATKVQSFPLKNEKNIIKVNQNKQLPNIGKFQLVYDTSTQYKELQQIFERTRIYEEAINELNKKNLNLPVNIPVIFTDCGTANAFYDPKNKRVLMCYELFIETFAFFKEQGFPQQEALQKSIDTGILILFHEVGHALVNILQLAITGKEEDTVDDFAAIMLSDDNNRFNEEILIIGGSFFLSAQSNIPHWSEHSFGQQRFYNWICILYGKNPQKYANFAKKVELGEHRAKRCPREYQQKILSWQRLLAPHSLNDTNINETNITPSNTKPIY